MKDYLFVLGRDPELSVLEIISYFKTYNLEWKLINYDKEAAIFDIDNFNFGKAIARLGGTIKIGTILSQDRIEDLDIYSGTKNKLSYFISTYGKISSEIKFETYLASWFKKNKIRATRRRSDKTNLTPRDLSSNSLEFILYKNYIAKTVAISDPSEYKRRDKERPNNDFLRSISIRLAKILINLCGAKEGKYLLDPFCGMGILLQEALLMNINAIGVELDPKVANLCMENLDFTVKRYNLHCKYKIYNGNSSNLISILGGKTIDCVASEPYLGPYFKKIPDKKTALKVASELNNLYSSFFKSLRNVLKNDGRVAILFPVFKTISGKVKMDIENILNKNGFKIADFNEKLKLPIVYKKKGSIVDREIYILEMI